MSSPNDSNKDTSKQSATPQPQHNRRSSITDFFNRSQGGYTGPVTSAVAEANQRRRMSVAGTSPVNSSGTTGSFLNSFAARRGSVSSVSSAGSGSAIADDESGENGSPKGLGSAFARRMSFGAKAMMDVKTSRQAGFMNKGIFYFRVDILTLSCWFFSFLRNMSIE